MNQKIVAANVALLIAFVAGGEARASSGCEEAEKVISQFIRLEASGKRLYTNADYAQLLTYKTEDGELGDEPGWDSVHLVDSATLPQINGCRAEQGSFVISVEYVKVGEDNGGVVCTYGEPKHKTETLVVKLISGSYRIDGLQIYQPYTSLKVANKIAPTSREQSLFSARCEAGAD